MVSATVTVTNLKELIVTVQLSYSTTVALTFSTLEMLRHTFTTMTIITG